jgi:gp16 family phage-associated protein
MQIVIDTQRANDIKQRLYKQKLTVKQWAANHGYQYHTVSNVLRGVNKATFGAGREVAEKLIQL